MYFENHNGYCNSDKIFISYNVMEFTSSNELHVKCCVFDTNAVEPHKVKVFSKKIKDTNDTFWIIFSAMKNKLTDRQHLFDYLLKYIENNE